MTENADMAGQAGAPGRRRGGVSMVAAIILLALYGWLVDRASLGVQLTSYLGVAALMWMAIPLAGFLLAGVAITNRLGFTSVLAALLLSLLAVANALKLRYLDQPVEFADLYIVGNVHLSTLHLLKNYVSPWVLAGGLLVLLAASVVALRRERPFFQRRVMRLASAIMGVAVLYGLVVGSAWAGKIYSRSRLDAVPWAPTLTVFRAGVLPSLLEANIENAVALDESIDRDALASLRAMPYPDGDPPGTSKTAQPSVSPDIIIIQSESFFDPAIIRQVDSSASMLPSLDQARRSTRTGWMGVPAFGGGTLRTEFEVLTGVPLSAFPRLVFPYLQINQATIPGLPRVLKKYGYTTIALHGNEGSFWNRDRAFASLGFDRFITRDAFPADAEHDGWYLSDRAMTDQLETVLSQSDAPTFVFAISIEGHGPYARVPVKDTARRDTIPAPSTLDPKAALEYRNYLYHIEDADRQLGRLKAFLDQRGKPYVLAFYGDHLPGFERVYPEVAFDNGAEATAQRVPWLLYGPGVGTQADQQIRSWMLPAEVLRAAGLPLNGYDALVDKTRALLASGKVDQDAVMRGLVAGARSYLEAPPKPDADASVRTRR